MQVELFKNSPTGRKLHMSANQLPPNQTQLPSLNKVRSIKDIKIVRYAYRSFDRQYLIADARFIDRPGPSLWQAHSDDQIYFTSLFSIPLDKGPALIACSDIPDLDFFRGSYGGKAVIPLYRNSACTQPNILPGLLEMLGKRFSLTVKPEDFAGYAYGILAQPEYSRLFADDLSNGEVHVPITKDKKLFMKVSEFGKNLIWIHTYGNRLFDCDHPPEAIKGKARCTQDVSNLNDKYPNEFRYDEDHRKLHVGDGVFAPVSPDIWEFEVSGLKVVQSWLGYRMRERKGKKSSPLDDQPTVWTHEFTRELLELLWVLEITVEGYPKQKQLLENVLNGELFTARELPLAPESAREAPKTKKVRAHKDQFSIDLDGDE